MTPPEAKHRFGESPLWARYAETRVTKESALDLTDFKSTGVNHKLAMWDPSVNGVRYVKALLYHMGMHLSPENLARLRNTPSRELGTPIAVRCRGELMCVDYLLAVHELEFLTEHVTLEGARVLEIGAGYGRTCHTMMSNHDVASYHIVDLPNTLALSAAYLTRVLPPEQLARVHFVPIDEADALFAVSRFDLCINIDSFAEMTQDTVHSYLAAIDETCRWFYVNNPVGKYSDPSLDNHSHGADLVDLAMSTGLLRDVIDISDMDQVQAQVPLFLDAYRPGAAWEPVADHHHPAYQHYWQGLYRRTPSPPSP